MPKPIFDTKTLTLAEILGNAKTYYVPKFQRSYSWKEEEWEDLWQDILILKNNEENIHYLGTIVLKTDDNKTFEVIDGQQRLATLSIIILTCMAFLDDLIAQGFDIEKNNARKDLYLNNYIGFKEPKSLTYKPKLVLNQVDKDIYSSYLTRLKKPQNVSRLPDSNKLIIQAYDYFREKVKQMGFTCGEEVVDFIENVILSRLILIQIVVEDSLSAYTVFETLNARGIELTTTDLLKNYLFSVLDNEIDINTMLPIWDRIVNIVSYKHFPEFLRYHINSQQKLIRTERLFKEIRSKVAKKEDVFKLLDELEKNAELYVAFDDPEHPYWAENRSVKKLIEEISLFNVKQHKSLLLSCWNRIPGELEKVLRIIRAIAFRYNVIGKFNPNELEKAYNDTAVKVFSQQIIYSNQIQKNLENVYVKDEKFQNLFSTISFKIENSRERKLVKYILLSIENQRFKKDYPIVETDATIEHIMSESSGKFERDNDNMLCMLGNLTLLEPKLNKEASNMPFNRKIEIYKRSQFGITREIAERWENWGFTQIKQRQREFAKLATSIWATNY